MVHVHGGKHQISSFAEAIIDTINAIPHHTIVDPFLGSGTFVREDHVAEKAVVNALGMTQEDFLKVVDSLPQDSIASSNQHAIDFLERRAEKDDTSALLVLDPPRPSSDKYEVRWTQADANKLLGIALSWAGPVVYAGYLRDTPAIEGGGWHTFYPIIETSHIVSENSGVQDPIHAFVSWKQDKDQYPFFPTEFEVSYQKLTAAAQKVGSSLLYHHLDERITSGAQQKVKQLQSGLETDLDAEDILIDSLSEIIAAQYVADEEHKNG